MAFSARLTVTSKSEEDTIAIGRAIGKLLDAGDVVALTGNLGAGKTIIAKGLAEGLGVKKKGEVTSPTYKILNKYEGRLEINHFDVYRLGGASDFADTGGEEILWGGGVSIIEWAEKIAESLPDERIGLNIKIVSDTVREIEALVPDHRHQIMSLLVEWDSPKEA